MFPSYPGFEDLPLRVEVEWQGRARPVVARLEQWPGSTDAVVVCAFEDDSEDGEWLVIGNGQLPYTLANPYTKVLESTVYRVATRQPILVWKPQMLGDERVREKVRAAFRARTTKLTVARLLQLDELTGEPKIALRTAEKSSWLAGKSHQSWVEFEGQKEIQLSAQQAQLNLEYEWEDERSFARFAWEWASLSDEKRNEKIGFSASKTELNRVMQWVLSAATNLAETGHSFSWWFSVDEEIGKLEGTLWDRAANSYPQIKAIDLWQKFLLSQFTPQWRDDLWVTHCCVQQWTRNYPYEFGYVDTNAPTAHEQLEAKLALRDWLQGKVTPQQARELLESLDS